MIHGCADWFSREPQSLGPPCAPHSPRKRHRQQVHKMRSATSRARPSREPSTMPAMAPGPRAGPAGNKGREGGVWGGQAGARFPKPPAQPSLGADPGPQGLLPLSVLYTALLLFSEGHGVPA